MFEPRLNNVFRRTFEVTLVESSRWDESVSFHDPRWTFESRVLVRIASLASEPYLTFELVQWFQEASIELFIRSDAALSL